MYVYTFLRQRLFLRLILKNSTFCKVYFTTLFRVMLNNRALFHNNRYCGVDKKAVILHSIKYGPF